MSVQDKSSRSQGQDCKKKILKWLNSHCFGEGTLGTDTSAEISVQSCGGYSASVVLPTNRIQYKYEVTE